MHRDSNMNSDVYLLFTPVQQKRMQHCDVVFTTFKLIQIKNIGNNFEFCRLIDCCNLTHEKRNSHNIQICCFQNLSFAINLKETAFTISIITCVLQEGSEYFLFYHLF